MIRDEFIKQRKERDFSTKEMAKVRKMGERSFYTNEIAKLTNLRKTFNLSSWIIGVLLVIITAVILYAIIASKSFVQSLVLPVIIVSIFWVLILSWVLILRPTMKKKTERYKLELDRIRQESLEKQRKIYANMNK